MHVTVAGPGRRAGSPPPRSRCCAAPSTARATRTGRSCLGNLRPRADRRLGAASARSGLRGGRDAGGGAGKAALALFAFDAMPLGDAVVRQRRSTRRCRAATRRRRRRPRCLPAEGLSRPDRDRAGDPRRRPPGRCSRTSASSRRGRRRRLALIDRFARAGFEGPCRRRCWRPSRPSSRSRQPTSC